MADKFCDSCGTAMPDGVRFCPNCGKVFAASAAPVPPPVNPAPQPIQYAAPAPNYNYAQPQPNYYQQAPAADNSPLKVGQYIGIIIVSGLPLIGFIMLLVWAFSSSTNLNKKNYARAVLLLSIIGGILGIIFGAAIMAALSSIINSNGGYYGY